MTKRAPGVHGRDLESISRSQERTENSKQHQTDSDEALSVDEQSHLAEFTHIDGVTGPSKQGGLRFQDLFHACSSLTEMFPQRTA